MDDENQSDDTVEYDSMDEFKRRHPVNKAWEDSEFSKLDPMNWKNIPF